ncbi:MAG: chemotaxis protein MotB [Planctomycetota bacterium]|jgi:chemotaxis protein MotB
MSNTHGSHNGRRLLAGFSTALLLAASMASCASPQDVAYTRELAKDYESQVFDLERQLAEKNAELAKVREDFAKEMKAGLTTAGFDGSMETRLDSLAAMIDQRGGAMKDVERFDVEGGYLLMIQDKILFDSGSASLGGSGTAALGQIASEIAAAAHGEIFVRGHTDSDPVRKPETLRQFPHGNLQLSAERAVAVAAYLIEKSALSGKDVVVMGFGSWRPVKPNSSAESKRLNRRVEIFVSDPES